MEVSSDQLQRAVVTQHHCSAALVRMEFVSEEFHGRAVWQGMVHVFGLEGHPTATRAYAESSPIEGSDKRRFFAVLHVPPIKSAADAVRAAIVAEFRAGKPNPSRGGDST